LDFRGSGHRKLRTRLPNPDYVRHVSCIYWEKWRDAAPRSLPFAQTVAFQRLPLNSRVLPPRPSRPRPRHPSCSSRGFAEEVSNVGPRNPFFSLSAARTAPFPCPFCPPTQTQKFSWINKWVFFLFLFLLLIFLGAWWFTSILLLPACYRYHHFLPSVFGVRNLHRVKVRGSKLIMQPMT